MNFGFTPSAWAEYTEWQIRDRAIAKKINELIKDIQRNGLDDGIGKPEPLRHGLSGKWSRRITQEHRLVYSLDENGNLLISSCFGHYE